MKLRFVIPGEPTGKGRPRFTNAGHTYTPKKTVDYERRVRAEFIKQCGHAVYEQGVPLDVRITAYMTIPKSASQKKRKLMVEHKIRPTKKPDFDNIGKVVCDSLNGLAYHDDAQVVDAQVRKFYGEEPRVVVTISEADL